MVEGVLFDSDGDPVPWYGGVVAHAQGLSDSDCQHSLFGEGQLYFAVADGSSSQITIAVYRNYEFVGWYPPRT